MKMKPKAKRRTRGTTATTPPCLSIAESWRAAFDPRTAHRFVDLMERLAVWRDKLPAARRRKMLTVWDDIRDGLSEASVAQSIADAQQTVRVAIYGIPRAVSSRPIHAAPPKPFPASSRPGNQTQNRNRT